MKLIREICEAVEPLYEDNRDGTKNLYIHGIFCQAGIVNRNNRLYPPEILSRECERYVREQVNHGSAFAELGHPPNPQINLDRISHRIVELKPDGQNWLGKAIVLNEGCGRILKGILESGGRIGVSSRALGSVKRVPAGHDVVSDDLRLVCAGDVVANPSAPGAWMESLVEGGPEWVWSDQAQGYVELIGDYRTKIRKMTSRDLAERKATMFGRFISHLTALQE